MAYRLIRLSKGLMDMKATAQAVAFVSDIAPISSVAN
jgi:hypothetical protein